MQQNEQKIKYFLYARKSSESEDRQIQSIDDQVNRLKELSDNLGLKIKKNYTEAKSAKKPNNRPVFEKMMKQIENGEADGILCWQINRLSRNPIDSGKLSWLLQQNVLKAIQTIDRQYLPSDNVLLFNVESGMANQYILDLSKVVKRGLRGKLERGWLPSNASLGYLNDLLNKTIVKDPERFDLVRKMWDLMLTGNYTPPQILKIANDEWGFKTRKTKRAGGVSLSKSGIYRIFTNPFYTGIIKYKGKQYEGKHEPMITLEEFDRVQVILGRKGKPRPKIYEFPFTGLIRCGECGCLITAEEKTKHIKSTGEIKKYTYYHCTRQKKEYKCKQPSITVQELEKQIDQELAKMTILPEFKDWALEVLNENNNKEITNRSKVYEMQHKTLISYQKQLDNLTKMRYRGLITDEEFIKERNVLQNEISKLKEKLRRTEQRAEDWLDLTEKAFEFATHARIAFINGDIKTKKEIIRTIGTEFVLEDKKLFIKAEKWLQPIRDGYPALETEYQTLELGKSVLNKAKTEALTSVRARWQGYRDSNPSY